MASFEPVAWHLTARIERPEVSLCDYDLGGWLWERLQEAFPFALAACLMPDHPHVVTPLSDPAAGRRRLNRLLGHLARRVGVRYVGCAAEPTPVRDRMKLQRDVRYVALNPPREELVRDPLAWMFSTHRDVMGASVDPWVTADRLAAALHRPRRDFEAWFHHYVSADPHVDRDGTPAPHPAPPTDVPTAALGTIANAVAAATRRRPEEIRTTGHARVLFVALARDQGWRNVEQLANACMTGTRAIYKIAQRIDPGHLAAARLCLGDRRLLAAVPRWRNAEVVSRHALGPEREQNRR